MIGSALSFTGFLLVLFVLNLWVVVRIWKRSPLLAILSFFFWPVSIIALITHWGDEESDIRVPFFLSLAVGVLMLFTAMRTVEQGVQEMAYALSDEDIALIRQDDPELAQQLEEARADQLSEMDEEYAGDEYAEDGDSSGDVEARSTPARARQDTGADAAPAPVAVARDPAAIEAEHRISLERAAGAIAWQFGRIQLPGTVLQLPQHFRFAQRSSLLYVARLRNTPLPSDVLGWVVHRDVSLAREDGWFVQVRHVPLASPLALPEPVADATARALEDAALVGRIATALDASLPPPRAPAWDAANGIATWERSAAGVAADAPFADHVAARVLPAGLLEFVVPSLHAAHAQLGTRAARLMAQRANTAGAAATAAR